MVAPLTHWLAPVLHPACFTLRSAALIGSFTHSLAPKLMEKVVFVHDRNASISYIFNPLRARSMKEEERREKEEEQEEEEESYEIPAYDADRRPEAERELTAQEARRQHRENLKQRLACRPLKGERGGAEVSGIRGGKRKK